MKTDIYVVHHQEPNIALSDYPPFITHIQTGRALQDVHLDMIGDDTGVSISEKNKQYGELTAHYWVWKNKQDSDIVGFQHYRRLFDFSSRFSIYPGYEISFFFYNTILKHFSEKNILDIFKRHEWVIPKAIPCVPNIPEQFSTYHLKEDWDICWTIFLKKLSPSMKKYAPSFSNDSQLHACILYLTRFEHFDAAMTWLFDILEEIEPLLPKRDGYQSRNIAFFAERLMHFYFRYLQEEKNMSLFPASFPCFSPVPPRIQDLYFLLK